MAIASQKETVQIRPEEDFSISAVSACSTQSCLYDKIISMFMNAAVQAISDVGR